MPSSAAPLMQPTLSSPLALARLARPANTLVAGAAVWAGALLAGAPLAPQPRVWIGILAAIAFSAAGNVRNDLSDVEIDRRAHPERPLVTGAVSPRAARALALGLYAIAGLAAGIVSPIALVLVLLAIPLIESYERTLKARGLPGNLAIAVLTAAPFVLGAIATQGTAWPRALGPIAFRLGPAVLVVALLAALATAGREVLKDVEDVESDRSARRTLPMRIGARGAAMWAAAFLVAAALLSPLPWALESVLAWPYLVAVALADGAFVAAAVVGFARPDRAQRFAKLGMVLALVALVVGRVM